MSTEEKAASRFPELFAKLLEDIDGDEREAIINEIDSLSDQKDYVIENLILEVLDELREIRKENHAMRLALDDLADESHRHKRGHEPVRFSRDD